MTSAQSDDTPPPDYQASIEFLEKWCKGGPWVLVAIDPNKKGIEVGTFNGNDIPTLTKWLEEQGTTEKRNLYFTVNPCVRSMKTKPSREHIMSLSWLHVDLDPRAGEDLDSERARIIALLRDPEAKGIPKPTALVFSGGGYQAFWRLKEPHLLDGTAAEYEEAKRWNKQLELVLGGDNCHNVDRIMRLVGSVNRPDPKKRKKGRVEIRAELIEFNTTQHDLKLFTKAPQVQGGEATGFAGNTVKISGNLARISSTDDLPKGVSDQAKVCIVQGFDPDNPEKFGNSRSEWLFFVCCELVRGGCDDDLIYSVITDPDFGISVSVLDKGSGTERYAIRQIERAREEAIEPMLREFNDKHAVIGSIGKNGICRILSEEWDSALERSRIAYQNQTDFMLRYKPKTVDWTAGDGKIASKPAALWWLEHPLRRYFDTVVFAPGKDTPGAYNLWKGFAVDAIPGEIPLFDAFVENVVANGVPEVVEYLWRYVAWTVQHPDKPAEVAIVMRGGQGTGKGTFVSAIGYLFGRHYLTVTGAGLIAGQFNAHLRECVLMFADEQTATDDREVAARFKVLITERMIMTEAKGVDAEPTPNYLHIFIASNATWVVPVDDDDRRYVVLDISEGRKQDETYFAAIRRELEDGGYEALFHRLLNMDLGDWHPRRNRPRTAAHAEQKVDSLVGLEAAWFEFLSSGELPVGRPGDDGSVWAPSSDLLACINDALPAGRKKVKANALKNLLEGPQANARGNGMDFERERREHYGKKLRGYVVPPLAEARRRWDAQRFPYPWDADECGWIVRAWDGPGDATFR